MTEVEYEHECSRAELLGIPKPTWEEFLSSRKDISAEERQEEEEVASTEQAEEAEARKEGFRKIAGGLDELNSILSSTQKKLNRFKTVCGSFSNLLKIHIGTKKDEEAASNTSDAVNDDSEAIKIDDENKEVGSQSVTNSPHVYNKGDTNSELDKLDSLINKAERAELSLSSQNKQMKKFLN